MVSVSSPEAYVLRLLKTYRTYRVLVKHQWLSRDRINQIQERRLTLLLKHAYATVPYYRALFDEAGVAPQQIESLKDLKKIPVTRKADLQVLNHQSIVSSLFHLRDLRRECTSGSTGQPFGIYYEHDFVTLRNLLFLRALNAVGYRIGQKILLITDTRNKHSRNILPGWHYAAILESPQHHFNLLNRVKPAVLYGCKTSLKLLAEHAMEAASVGHKPGKIISTAESLDRATRTQLAKTFDAEVYDFYGLSEMGIVGWECYAHTGYHLAEDSTIVEYLPADDIAGASKLVMTNLNLYAMPLIRFETGDLVLPGTNKNCPCGRTFTQFEQIEGRIADVIRMKNGSKISPYRLTCALENVAGLKTYQVIQKNLDSIMVKFEPGSFGKGAKEEQIRHTVKKVLGDDIQILIEKTTNLFAIPGRKFRIVESHL
jgi:phenylacetate-CoA ligase